MELFVYDDFKWVHVMGPLLAILGMLALSQNMVNKEKGLPIRPWRAVILIAAALFFHFFWGDGSFLDRVSIVLADFGIAMFIGSGYLGVKKTTPNPFWALGLVAMMAGLVIYVASHFFGYVWNGMKNGFSDPVAGQVLLELGPDDNIEELNGLLMQYDAKPTKAFPEVTLSENEDLAQYFLVELNADEADDFISDALKDKENVDHCEENYVVSYYKPITGHVSPTEDKGYMTNDPMIGSQWWFPTESANSVHGILKDLHPAKRAKVAIVDTGVDGTHEDLQEVFSSSPGNKDGNGHGTHCAGLAGAATNNGIGMASYNWNGKFVEVAGYQALSPEGHGSSQTVARAIIRAAEDGADVISLSLGGPHRKPPKAEVKAIEYAHSLGAIVVVAAGNSNSDARYYSPANIKGVICVAALDQSHQKAGFSNTNTSLKRPIAAPGVDIFSSLPGGQYAPKSGTSMATPIVAGIVGVMKAINPDLTPEQAYNILHGTGVDIEDADKTGRMINPEEAILKLIE